MSAFYSGCSVCGASMKAYKAKAGGEWCVPRHVEEDRMGQQPCPGSNKRSNTQPEDYTSVSPEAERRFAELRARRR